MFDPHIDQSDHQDAEENQDFAQHVKALAPPDPVQVNGRHRIEESDLDLENYENQGNKIEIGR